jgi:hypothetical protein
MLARDKHSSLNNGESVTKEKEGFEDGPPGSDARRRSSSVLMAARVACSAEHDCQLNHFS